MFDKISQVLGLKPDTASKEVSELHLATAALMVSVSKSDENYTDEEREVLIKNLQNHFSLTKDSAVYIADLALEDESDAPSLYQFTRAVSKELDNEERQEIIRLLWQVAFADGHLDNFELNIIAKIAGLLGVSAQERIRIKHEVEQITHCSQ
ncbi:TerB family tellurite resistance protein [Kordiimonas sp. SCSIO 12603]|uniref:tellurite resistance TerB family protein n=1 Tax=Kordiimonas sp. SCSIO 12603 TaxID=2829596 RepID=UPI0021040E73|nr:TerB family tellurite resistance protein [Kordiimonas sp. SCSIO 12603]UTW57431.1 TerB family tellurite resistance protein [Kordiimonas sp. SCSIO 12603]